MPATRGPCPCLPGTVKAGRAVEQQFSSCPRLQSPHAKRCFPGSAGVPPASGPKAHRCVQAGKMPAIPGTRPCGAVFPGSAGVPPASGPKAHRCVQAGKMPALPGTRPCGAVFPGSAGVPPASGSKAHRCVQAGKMPALPGVASAGRLDLDLGRRKMRIAGGGTGRRPRAADGSPAAASGKSFRLPGTRDSIALVEYHVTPTCSSNADAFHGGTPGVRRRIPVGVRLRRAPGEAQFVKEST